MTRGGQGTGPGRGGQGGHEPRAQIQAREQRVLDRSVAGVSQRQIAQEEGITQSAVSKILRRVEARVLEELMARVDWQLTFAATAYNLVRLRNLEARCP